MTKTHVQRERTPWYDPSRTLRLLHYRAPIPGKVNVGVVNQSLADKYESSGHKVAAWRQHVPVGGVQLPKDADEFHEWPRMQPAVLEEGNEIAQAQQQDHLLHPLIMKLSSNERQNSKDSQEKLTGTLKLGSLPRRRRVAMNCISGGLQSEFGGYFDDHNYDGHLTLSPPKTERVYSERRDPTTGRKIVYTILR